MTAGIGLVSLDVDGLLGPAVRPKDPATVAAVVRRRLHPAADLTEELLQDVANDLDLPIRQVRDLACAPRPLRIDPTARALLAGLRDACPNVRMVVCSNLSAADRAHITAVLAELGHLLDGAYFSCDTGLVKGNGPAAFEHIAEGHGIDVAEIVHVGDTLHDDIHAPLLAGARALWAHPDHARSPRIAAADRFRTAADLAGAVTVLRDWIPASQPRPTLAVRAAALIRGHNQRILLVRGPDDEAFSLPGGRCESYGPDSPPAAMVREIHEELAITVRPGNLAWAGWSEAEATSGHNKIHFIFNADIVGATVPIPDPTEIAEIHWATHHEALCLLHSAEADRLHRITCDRTHGWQHHTTRPL